MVSGAIKLQKIVLLQQQIIRLHNGRDVKLPTTPDLFLSKNDIPSDASASEKLIYCYFLDNKNIRVSIREFVDRKLAYIDLVALAVYKKYFPVCDILEYLLEEYPEIQDDEQWFA